MNFINFIESDENDKDTVGKIWKKLTVTNIMYKYYCIVQRNAFVTPQQNGNVATI